MNDVVAAGAIGGVELGLTQTPGMVLHVSPAMIQYARLLAMGAEQVEGLVTAEIAENPALEIGEVLRCPGCGSLLVRSRCIGCRGADGARCGPSVRLRGSPEPSAKEASSSLADVLVDLRRSERRIADYVLGNLSPRGLLDMAPATIAADTGASEQEVVDVIDRLREGVGPGFAASSIEECLLRQLDALVDCPEDDKRLCRRAIESHLGALARGELGAVARSLGVAPGRIRELLELIRTSLRPPSGLSLGRAESPIPFVTPDIVVTLEGDELEVEVVERHRFPLLVNDACGRAMAARDDVDASESARLAGLVGRARGFVDRLEGRWLTLQRIAEATILFQESFVRHGPERLRPLTRAQIAAVEGLHESTVSRATRSKFVLLPARNLVPFSRFFDASAAPKEALRKILSRERPPR